MLRAVGSVSPDTVSKLASSERLQTLEEVLRWPGMVVEIVVQDEYTHDVVVSTPHGFVVFDTT